MTTEQDRINQLAYATKKAMEKGMEEGLEEGLQKGRAEGLAEGKAIAAREMALALLRLGVSEDIIVQSTGLHASEVEALRES